jgi:hypothetical protein
VPILRLWCSEVVTAAACVHGGFVDGSGRQGVYDLLTADGYRVSVVQNPTRDRREGQAPDRWEGQAQDALEVEPCPAPPLDWRAHGTQSARRQGFLSEPDLTR